MGYGTQADARALSRIPSTSARMARIEAWRDLSFVAIIEDVASSDRGVHATERVYLFEDASRNRKLPHPIPRTIPWVPGSNDLNTESLGEAEATMSNVLNWQLGREMELSRTTRRSRAGSSPSSSTSTAASAARPAPWPANHLDLLARARNTCGGTTSRPNPTAATRSILGREDARPARAGQSRRPDVGRQTAERQKKPLRQVQRQDDLRGAETRQRPEGATGRSAICRPTRNGRANIYEDNPIGDEKGVRKDRISRRRPLLPEHKTWFFYLARICNHCTYPACLAACPRNAIYKRPEDGIVLIDQERCRGYRKCVEACPYKKTMYRGTTRASEKCIGCYPARRGQRPAKAAACRWKRAAWRPASARSACRGWSK